MNSRKELHAASLHTFGFLFVSLYTVFSGIPQYEKGIPHDKGSAMLAEKIMNDCGFNKKEQEEVLSAILQHRIRETRSLDSFSGLIYRADKASRACLFCSARNACNWDEEKKNLKLTV